ncbi:lipase family protein [Microbulbifer sp. 2201CG32-9]|uniref:lipase family protein n=1 Tax=Microbulbifer sp. 2201CG32-9 TaxID=3232309 RepID=UPI00345B799F
MAFRGTEKSWADVKTDLRFNMVPPGEYLRGVTWPRGAVAHAGFTEGLASVVAGLEEHLKPYAARDYPIFFTGHSLGGALANLACLHFEQLFRSEIGCNPIAACYTFGAPRLGNAALMGLCKTPVYRYVNAADPVPKLPPEAYWIKFGMSLLKGMGVLFSFPRWVHWIQRKVLGLRSYCHQGSVRFLLPVPDTSSVEEMSAHLKTAPSLVANPSTGFQVTSLWSYVLRRRKMRFVKDHSIENYIIKLHWWTKRQNADQGDTVRQADTRKNWRELNPVAAAEAVEGAPVEP